VNRPEQQIHKAVVAHLRARSEPRVFFWHTPNGGKRGIVEAKIFKALGVIAGVPDLIILKAGEMYALELKASKGRVTPAQRLVLDRLIECGSHVAVATSLDEALITLECWGILKRDSSHRVPSNSRGDAKVA
jgi:hypothetical protein